MKIVSITDVHGKTEKLEKLFRSSGPVDLTLITGDLTDFGSHDEAEEVVETVKRWCPQVLAVAGNCDYPGVDQYLKENNISLDKTCQIHQDHAFLGMSKSLPGPGRTPNETTEQDFAAGLAAAVAQVPDGMPKILVIHQPPYDTINDEVMFGRHVGSRSIRAFIETHQPTLVFCGHIHEGVGIGTIGSTRIVNPGPLHKGKYAYAHSDNGNWHVEIRPIE
jgi:Icc-related predicted phosphoesterase